MFSLSGISPATIVALHAGACASYLHVVKQFYCGAVTEPVVIAETKALVAITKDVLLDAEALLAHNLHEGNVSTALAVTAAVAQVGRCFLDTYDGSVARVPCSGLKGAHATGKTILVHLTAREHGCTLIDNCFSAMFEHDHRRYLEAIAFLRTVLRKLRAYDFADDPVDPEQEGAPVLRIVE